MEIINFSHPITSEQLSQLEIITNLKVEQVIDVPVQFENQEAFLPQLKKLVERLPLNGSRLQTEAVLINLPAHNMIAAMLLAELHGRMGYFPAVIRIPPVPGSTPPRYDVAEIINLQSVRDEARKVRQ